MDVLPSAASQGFDSGGILLRCVGMATMGHGTRWPESWALLADEDNDDDDDEELAPLTPLAAKSSVLAAPPAQPSVGRDAEARGGARGAAVARSAPSLVTSPDTAPSPHPGLALW